MNDAMLEAMMRELGEKPRDAATWCAIADYLDEHGEERRAELARLVRRMRLEGESWTKADSERVQELLASGVKPVVPTVTNSIGMKFAWIVTDPVEFWMGADQKVDSEAFDNEAPRHKVRLTRPFALGICTVTQGQYQSVMGNNPSWFCVSGDGANDVQGMDTSDFPVEQVSRNELTKLITKLNNLRREKKAGRKYRLPTEAEWEYACRARVPFDSDYNKYQFGDGITSKQANFWQSGPKRTTKVGSYPANAFGLHDMHGNVWEWCQDWMHIFSHKQETDPIGLYYGSLRVVRGGGWGSNPAKCRSASRGGYVAASRINDVGCRVVLASS
jgi:uncharacterized protein (TIGR02996 family)